MLPCCYVAFSIEFNSILRIFVSQVKLSVRRLTATAPCRGCCLPSSSTGWSGPWTPPRFHSITSPRQVFLNRTCANFLLWKSNSLITVKGMWELEGLTTDSRKITEDTLILLIWGGERSAWKLSLVKCVETRCKQLCYFISHIFCAAVCDF